MKIGELPGAVRDVALRLLPHRTPTGLEAVGRPGRDAPVLLTGNYAMTRRRLRRALRGLDAWVLAANSNGINVWCAAGGGHLTHHDVIAVIRSSKIAERVDHRELVLPQLAATGVERHKIADATGWRATWGPAHFDDLPDYLRRGRRTHRQERLVRFPLRDRMEMALAWALPLAAIGGALAHLSAGPWAGAAVSLVAAVAAFGLFGLTPWLDLRGHRRTVFVSAGLAAGLVGAGSLPVLGAVSPSGLFAVGLAAVLSAVILKFDFEGSTPWYGSVVADTTRSAAHIELSAERCRGAADCVQVCPKGVFEMDGRRRVSVVTRPDECLQCGACIVQCPHDALQFRYDDGRVLGPDIIRSTRLNLAGRRAVRIDPKVAGR